MDGAGEARQATAIPRPAVEGTVFAVLAALSFSHVLNDLISSLVPAIYPVLKASFDLDFAEIGLITLTYQLTASLLQPLVGLYTDRRPRPYSLAAGMGFTLLGLLLLAGAGSFAMVLAATALVGVGSSVFHPESSRIARLASGGRHGFAQSLFQVGGNAGQALGPLLAALIIVPKGQASIAWFALVPILAMVLLWQVGGWYRHRRLATDATRQRAAPAAAKPLATRQVTLAIAILIALIFSKYFYLMSINSFYTFYLIEKFHLSVAQSQIYLFVFLVAVACGTFLGGPIGDRFSRKYVIWGSIFGILPFTLLLPDANLFWTGILSVPIGLILASAFSVIVVYAQDLLPGRIGMISGLFFGFAFGMAGIGAAALGALADLTSIDFMYRVCSFLPVIGLLAAGLPNLEKLGLAVKRGAAGKRH